MNLRPNYQTMTVRAALRRNWRGYVLQEKLDGRWQEKTVGGCRMVGELMPDKEFRPFDLLSVRGQDVSGEPASFRLETLAALCPALKLRPAAIGSGPEFIEAVLAAGGEGCVAKRASSAFGHEWVKIKRVETHDCTITDIHGESISIAENGIERGRCPVVGGKLIDGSASSPAVAR